MSDFKPEEEPIEQEITVPALQRTVAKLQKQIFRDYETMTMLRGPWLLVLCIGYSLGGQTGLGITAAGLLFVQVFL